MSAYIPSDTVWDRLTSTKNPTFNTSVSLSPCLFVSLSLSVSVSGSMYLFYPSVLARVCLCKFCSLPLHVSQSSSNVTVGNNAGNSNWHQIPTCWYFCSHNKIKIGKCLCHSQNIFTVKSIPMKQFARRCDSKLHSYIAFCWHLTTRKKNWPTTPQS